MLIRCWQQSCVMQQSQDSKIQHTYDPYNKQEYISSQHTRYSLTECVPFLHCWLVPVQLYGCGQPTVDEVHLVVAGLGWLLVLQSTV